MINPETGWRVFKTSKLGKQIRESQSKKKKKTSSKSTSPKPFYGYQGATKRPPPPVKKIGNTKGCVYRPSARDYFDKGNFGPVFYADEWHKMVVDSLGRPKWQQM